MGILQDKKTRVLIVIMVALVFVGLAVANEYYKNFNAQNDPRVVEARRLYENYNTLAQVNNFTALFDLLDSIETIYSNYPHYRNSYEVGVLYNNRSAAYLLMALFNDSIHMFTVDSNLLQISKDSLFSLSSVTGNKSKVIYENWLSVFDNKEEKELKKILKNDFLVGLDGYEKSDIKKFLNRRTEEIINAQIETKRRLSVSYTNLGIIHRHRDEYKDAIECYKRAIDLWDRNLTAENNLNILLGRPTKKRNFIQKMFPPDKKN
jgi:tetratricopeptide (TPR) repeat protein